MKIKYFLILMGIIFLLLGTNIASAGIWDDFLNLFSDEKTIDDLVNDDVYKELILNDAVNTEAIFTLKNPVENINIKRDDIKINFNVVCGGINSYKLLINSTCEAERVKKYVYDMKEFCYNQSQIEDICELNCSNSSIEEICYNQSFIKETIYENYTYPCYKEFDQIDANDLRNIKIDANVRLNKCSDGTFGYKIDWMPEIKLSDNITEKILINEKWAWWNVTYAYKMPINCTNMDDLTPLVINGSDGFEINGEKQIVWTYCSGTGTAVYYNDEFDIVVANDTTQLPMEVEFGNGTSYNPTNVWGNLYTYHFGETSGTNAVDSASGENGTASNTRILGTDGKIGKCADFTQGDDYINIGKDLGNYAHEITISFWFKTGSISGVDGKYLMGGRYATTQELMGSYFDNSGTKIHFQYRTNAVDILHGGATHNMENNIWYHITLTLKGSTDTVQVIINNVSKEVSYTDQNTPPALSRDFGIDMYLGGYNNNGALYLPVTALVDEFRFSSGILTESEINQTYQNAIGTSGYGDLGAEEEQEAPPVYVLNGTVKDSNNIVVNNATIIVINQIDNTIFGITESNSTGGWNYTIDIGTYLVVAYDPNNSTRDGDADPHIIVS